jgi:hypothetical protein
LVNESFVDQRKLRLVIRSSAYMLNSASCQISGSETILYHDTAPVAI